MFHRVSKKLHKIKEELQAMIRVIGSEFESEVNSIVADPISRTAVAVGLGVCLFAGYKDTKDHNVLDELKSRKNYTQLVAEGKDFTPTGQIKKFIYDNSLYAASNFSINGRKLSSSEAQEMAIEVLNKIEQDGLLDEMFPIKSRTFFSLLFLIYVYIYTISIRKVKEKNMPVASAGFFGFSMVNTWFALKNGIMNFGSLGYIGAGAMGAITVYVNERVKHLIETHKVKQGIPEGFQEQIDAEIEHAQKEIEEDLREEIWVKNILQEYVLGDKNPVVIYMKTRGDNGFPEEKPLFWNPAMEQLTGYKFDEIKHLSQIEILKLLYLYDADEFNRVLKQLEELEEGGVGYSNTIFTIKSKNGTLTQVAWTSEKIKDGGRISFGSSEQAEIQKILRMDSQFDCLNGRSLYQDFSGIVAKYGPMKEIEDKNKIIAIVYSDIDNFKDFNNTYGHRIGDIVLNEYIKYIQDELRRKDDNLYRKGGDEFVILCNFVDKEHIKARIERIREHFSRFTIIVEFINGQMTTKNLEHGSYSEAQAYFDLHKASNQDINSRILQHEKNLEQAKDDLIIEGIQGTLVLPPITTSWGITDFTYNKDTATSGVASKKETVDELLQTADLAMYLGKKKSKNAVHIG